MIDAKKSFEHNFFLMLTVKFPVMHRVMRVFRAEVHRFARKSTYELMSLLNTR